MYRLAPSVLCAVTLSVAAGQAHADILTPDEVLRVPFTIDSNFVSAIPDVLSLKLGIIDVQVAYTTRQARLFDGTTLLGEDVKGSWGSFVGPLSMNPSNSFVEASSVWSFKGPTVVDFSSILDGTIDGLIEFRIETGQVDIDLNQVDLWMIQGTGPSSGLVVSPAPILGLVEIVGDALGTNYCISTQNSTGAASTISASGSASISANDLVLQADNLPAQPGIFIAGPLNAQIPFFNGFLCISPQGLQRFSNVSSPAGGIVSEAVDYPSSAAGGLNVVAGQPYYYQRWNRDPAGGGGAANFSDGIEVLHTP